MKKITYILILIVMSLILVSCKNKESNYNIDYEELKDLSYYNYFDKNNPVVLIEVKDYGNLVIELFPEVSKLTVDNFLYYAKNNLYKKSSFHRIIEGFMIQGGIVDETIDPIVGEFYNNGYPNNLYHYRGVISMARTSYPNSATSQFFIVHKDSHFLNGEYASFGGLVSGFEVLDLIANSITNFNDAPIDLITIKNVEVYLNGYEYNN